MRSDEALCGVGSVKSSWGKGGMGWCSGGSWFGDGGMAVESPISHRQVETATHDRASGSSKSQFDGGLFNVGLLGIRERRMKWDENDQRPNGWRK